MSARLRTPCAIVRWWQRLTSPVPQDTGAVLYGEYRGKPVLLCPVMSAVRPWIVQRWIKDPDAVREIDRILDGGDTAKSASEQTGTLAMPPLPSDSPSAPDVNPAAVEGL